MLERGGKWKSPLFMPRSASRILLEIKDIRVERLNGISEEDARAEGIYWPDPISRKDNFIQLWESIKGPGSWNKNPWVWVIEFEKIEDKL